MADEGGVWGEKYERAVSLADLQPNDSVAALREILDAPVDALVADGCSSTDAIRLKENAISSLGTLLAKEGRADELGALLTDVLRPFFDVISKAKTAKIVRNLIDDVCKIPDMLPAQIELCAECATWARESNRKFLRLRIETKLAELYFLAGEHQTSIRAVNKLARELKKLDDKALLLEVQLIESQVYHALQNVAKAKAALTSARTSANAIYCPPLLQAVIDMQAGILQAEEKDYKTAYSYFFETFEGYHNLDTPDKAVLGLKYMCLCKVMLGDAGDVVSILSNKIALNYAGQHAAAMQAIADAATKRSLHDFEATVEEYKVELSDDPIIARHLKHLYASILEQNLVRIIEPFSKVEIAHVAELIDLPVATVEAQLSRMILDGVFDGILDQGVGCLILFEPQQTDKTYPRALEVVANMSAVVDTLYDVATKIDA